MMDRPPEKSDLERWADKFEESSPVRKVAMLGGSAVRLTAQLLDRSLHRAAATLVDAERALKRELDPTMEEAKVLKEWDDSDKDRRDHHPE